MSEEPRIVHRGGANATTAATACRNTFAREMLRGSRMILAGFSGGPDSTALIAGLVDAWRDAPEPRPRLMALHIDHAVRPESAKEAAACARVAAQLSLPFRCLRADPDRVLVNGRVSEGRLRAERYRLFGQAAAETGASAIFLAHHRDDQAETVILAALRGAGLRGLSAMRRQRALHPSEAGETLQRPVRIVRPYLDVPRAELQQSLAKSGLSFLSDPTNDDPTFLRNAVRHRLLPTLRREIGPQIDGQLIHLARIARSEWRRACSRAQTGDLRTSDAQHAALAALADGEIPKAVSSLLQGAIGSDTPQRVTVRPGLDLIAGQGRVGRAESPPPLPHPALSISFHDGHAERLIRALDRLTPDDRRQRIERRGRLYLDADRLELPLCVRHREPGDRIQILGADQPKRLKTLLISRGVPKEDRDHLIVFEDLNRLVGFEGGPPAEHAALHAATRRTLRIVVRRPPPPS